MTYKPYKSYRSYKPHRTCKSYGFFVLFSFLFSCLASLEAQGHEPVAPVTRWLATVDDSSQTIHLLWAPNADSSTLGYHICTGNPCLAYDSLFGRFDTSYYCLDHLPTEAHTYRLHVFDTAYNVSSLTPLFGNIVLRARVPHCTSVVETEWTPYQGMPSGVARYTLWTRLEPFDSVYVARFSTDSAGPFSHSFELAEGVTRVWLKVQAISVVDSLVSQSNIVEVERHTADTALFFDISSLTYDSLSNNTLLTLWLDTAYHGAPYILWRSIDGGAWDTLASTLEPPLFTDSDVDPYDSLYCYRLSVADACGFNERSSEPRCVVIPDPPKPASAFPNVIVAGDPDNGTFRPGLQGLKGDLYELQIFNRYGILIYSTTDPAAGWKPQSSISQGVYVYHLRCRFNNNNIKHFTGSLLLLK